jgi:hypothetical protein
MGAFLNAMICQEALNHYDRLRGDIVTQKGTTFLSHNFVPPPSATKPVVGVYFTALYQALASRTRLLDHTQ